MAHHHERARVHTTAGPDRRRRQVSAGVSAHIDCDTCPVAGRGCAGCMVALLGPVRLRLDAHEQAAVDVLVRCGLVSAEEASTAHAVPELPDWMVAARDVGEEESPLRAIG